MDRAGNIWMGSLLTVGVLLLSQCAPSGKSLLTFLFDGVPEPDSTLAESQSINPKDSIDSGIENSAHAVSMQFVHYPYQEKECAACHDPLSLGTMVEPQPGLCYVCHEDFSTRFITLHGPVAGGYCTACHDPHMSEKEKLLRFTGEQLCFHCHQAESVYKNEMHEGLEGMTCTDCHNPHGGEDRYIFQ